ncbi:MAG TPA: hypothetical protein DDZ41_06715 [Flavobacterium sp.]|nr:hypothetical protein [Flavobacterium sp.]
MKKVVLSLALVAMMFVSCKEAEAPATEEVAADTTAVVEEVAVDTTAVADSTATEAPATEEAAAPAAK